MIFDPKKPTGKKHITAVLPFVMSGGDSNSNKLVRSGFIIGYDSGHIRVYMKSDSLNMPYKRAELDRDDLMMGGEYERSQDPLK
jgi:hypothetical protein